MAVTAEGTRRRSRVGAAGRSRRYSTYARSGNAPGARTTRMPHRSRRPRGPAPGRGPRAAPQHRRPRHGPGGRDRRRPGGRDGRRSPSPAARCEPRSPAGSASAVSRARRRRRGRPRPHRHDRRGARRRSREAATATRPPPPAASRPTARRGPGDPVRRRRATRVLRDRVGQGRRRQVVGHDQPGRRARPAGPEGRRRRRRRVGLLDPADARHRPRRRSSSTT